MKLAAIIPARMASSRFPGKPLLEIAGLPMIEHVRRRAELCPGFADVVVATCDAAIAQAVESFGGKVVMTAESHRVATERLVEAMQKLDCTHVVNVQGDEMLVLPSDLMRMVAAIEAGPESQIWNAVAPVEIEEELKDLSWVKCYLSQKNRFLFCTREVVHRWAAEDGFEPIFKVIGILAYSRSFLEHFSSLAPTPLEKRESIEQMRFLEHGYSVEAVRFEKGYVGVNYPHEMNRVQQVLKTDPLQKEILKRILGNG